MNFTFSITVRNSSLKGIVKKYWNTQYRISYSQLYCKHDIFFFWLQINMKKIEL